MPLERVVKALYAYEAIEEDELSFEEDQLMAVKGTENPEWLLATKLDADSSATGVIPVNYVEDLECLEVLQAAFDYSAADENELELNEGQQVYLMSRLEEDGGWWLVRNDAGHFGLVPSNYLAGRDDALAQALASVPDDAYVDPLTEYQQSVAHGAANDVPVSKVTSKPSIKPELSSPSMSLHFLYEWRGEYLDDTGRRVDGTLGITDDRHVAFLAAFDSSALFMIPLKALISFSEDEGVLRCTNGKSFPLRLYEVDGLKPMFVQRDFVGESEEEVAAAKAGQKVLLLRHVDADWSAVVLDATPGLIPRSYIGVETPVPVNEMAALKTESTASTTSSSSGSSWKNIESVASSTSPEVLKEVSPSIPLPPPLPPMAPMSPIIAVAKSPVPTFVPASVKSSPAPAFSAPPPPPPMPSADKASAPPKLSPKANWTPLPPVSKVTVTVIDSPSIAKAHTPLPVKFMSTSPLPAKASPPSSAAKAVELSPSQFPSASAVKTTPVLTKSGSEVFRRSPLPGKGLPDISATAVKQAGTSNPWEKISVKKPAPPSVVSKPAINAILPTANASKATKKALPDRPTANSAEKPKPGNTRLWNDKTGQFQVEAEFLTFVDGQVKLWKLNGKTINVPIDLLSERDVEFVYRKESIPFEGESAAKSPATNPSSWLAFLISIGIDRSRATRYADSLSKEKLVEAQFADLTRDFLKARGFIESDIMAFLKAASKRKAADLERAAMDANLERARSLKKPPSPTAVNAVAVKSPPAPSLAKSPSIVKPMAVASSNLEKKSSAEEFERAFPAVPEFDATPVRRSPPMQNRALAPIASFDTNSGAGKSLAAFDPSNSASTPFDAKNAISSLASMAKQMPAGSGVTFTATQTMERTRTSATSPQFSQPPPQQQSQFQAQPHQTQYEQQQLAPYQPPTQQHSMQPLASYQPQQSVFHQQPLQPYVQQPMMQPMIQQVIQPVMQPIMAFPMMQPQQPPPMPQVTHNVFITRVTSNSGSSSGARQQQPSQQPMQHPIQPPNIQGGPQGFYGGLQQPPPFNPFMNPFQQQAPPPPFYPQQPQQSGYYQQQQQQPQHPPYGSGYYRY